MKTKAGDDCDRHRLIPNTWMIVRDGLGGPSAAVPVTAVLSIDYRRRLYISRVAEVAWLLAL